MKHLKYHFRFVVCALLITACYNFTVVIGQDFIQFQSESIVEKTQSDYDYPEDGYPFIDGNYNYINDKVNKSKPEFEPLEQWSGKHANWLMQPRTKEELYQFFDYIIAPDIYFDRSLNPLELEGKELVLAAKFLYYHQLAINILRVNHPIAVEQFVDIFIENLTIWDTTTLTSSKFSKILTNCPTCVIGESPKRIRNIRRPKHKSPDYEPLEEFQGNRMESSKTADELPTPKSLSTEVGRIYIDHLEKALAERRSNNVPSTGMSPLILGTFKSGSEPFDSEGSPTGIDPSDSSSNSDRDYSFTEFEREVSKQEYTFPSFLPKVAYLASASEFNDAKDKLTEDIYDIENRKCEWDSPRARLQNCSEVWWQLAKMLQPDLLNEDQKEHFDDVVAIVPINSKQREVSKVLSDNPSLCTGIRIAPSVVLTAAHCTEDQSSNYSNYLIIYGFFVHGIFSKEVLSKVYQNAPIKIKQLLNAVNQNRELGIRVFGVEKEDQVIYSSDGSIANKIDCPTIAEVDNYSEYQACMNIKKYGKIGDIALLFYNEDKRVQEVLSPRLLLQINSATNFNYGIALGYGVNQSNKIGLKYWGDYNLSTQECQNQDQAPGGSTINLPKGQPLYCDNKQHLVVSSKSIDLAQICKGDSGGPTLVAGEDGNFYIAGIISYKPTSKYVSPEEENKDPSKWCSPLAIAQGFTKEALAWMNDNIERRGKEININEQLSVQPLRLQEYFCPGALSSADNLPRFSQLCIN